MTPTLTPTRTAASTPPVTATPTITPSSTAAVTPTFTPTRTGTPAVTPSSTAAVTPTRTPATTATQTPAVTPTMTPTPSSIVSVTLPANISDSDLAQLGAGSATAGIRFLNNGTWQRYAKGTSGTWLLSGSASNYDLYLTNLTGSVTTGPGFNVALNLGTTRLITVSTNYGQPDKEAMFDAQIRIAGTTTVVATTFIDIIASGAL